MRTRGFKLAKPSVKCPQCNGCGRKPLGDELFSVYASAYNGGQVTAVGLSKTVGRKVSVTAMNNRLEDLRALGLLTRERIGRRWHYKIA